MVSAAAGKSSTPSPAGSLQEVFEQCRRLGMRLSRQRRMVLDLLSLLPLEPLGVTGVIVGRALYDGRVELAEAIAALGEARLQDVTAVAADIA